MEVHGGGLRNCGGFIGLGTLWNRCLLPRRLNDTLFLEAASSVLRLLRVVVLHMLLLPSRLLQQEGYHQVDRTTKTTCRRLRPLLVPPSRLLQPPGANWGTDHLHGGRNMLSQTMQEVCHDVHEGQDRV